MSDASSPVPVSDVADRPATGLRLDARQRAMLEEMGVKVWWPAQRRSAPADASDAADVAGTGSPRSDAASARRAGGESGRDRPAVPASASVARTPVAPAATAPAPDGSASATRPPAVPVAPAPALGSSMPVSARAPASGPTAPAAGRTSPRDVPGVAFDAPLRLYTVLDEDGIASPPGGGWLVVADMPPEADGRHGEPFAGEAGRLLDNMLRALQLHDGRTPVHLMRTHRAAAPGAAAVTGRVAGASPADTDFAALAAPLAPRIVLALGPLAAQGLLRSAEPLGRLRGRAEPLRLAPGGPLDGVPVVASYPPAYLLRNPADKARAWADLCLAADRFAGPPA
jgi:DNA polymerase